MTLPDLIRESRERMQISQRELATRAGLAQGTVSKLERDQHEPDAYTLERIATTIGADPMELIVLARASAKLRRDEHQEQRMHRNRQTSAVVAAKRGR